ncbi:MAG: NADPH-dependent reductase, partial [Phenylobacterium sp.]|nr:NADPH-dependent reductase [Phenylobacterium sp.]
MTQARTVAVLVGSLRKDSASRKLANAFAALAPANLKFDVVEIGGLPHFDQDLESDPPAEWTAFRHRVGSADAVLFVTPEYNRSVPGVLKNAVDVGSRPYGHSAWNAKPGAVISLSPGAIGGFGANHHLRQSLVFLNVPLLSLEAYVGNAFALFDDAGELVNDSTTEFLRGYAAA